MSLLTRVWKLLTGDGDGGDEDIPERPPDEQTHREREFEVYEVTVEYRNGDTETFESYGRYSEGPDEYVWNTGLKPRRSLGTGKAYYTYDRRSIPTELLAREPVFEEIRTETWRLSWTTTYEKDTYFDGSFKKWSETPVDLELSRIDGEGGDQR